MQHLREGLFHYRGRVLEKDRKFPDLRSRITYVLEQMDWSQSDLAREVGAGSPGAVGNWLNRNQGMDPKFAFILQDKHRWNARWLLEGVGPARIELVDKETEELLQRLLELPADRRRALALLLGE